MKRYRPEFPNGEHGACRALTELTIDHLPEDATLGEPRSYRRHENVWLPDDRSDRIYLLRSGRIAVVATDAEGHEVLLRLIRAGEPFGELCFCGGPTKLRRTTATALGRSEVVEIELADFMSYVQSDRDLLTAVVFTFCIRLADAEQRIEILGARRADQRLGRLLLNLALAQGRGATKPQETLVVLPISHQDLARLAAMSRQHVTLVMGRLRSLGLVHYERGRPLVIDTAAVASFLGDD